jgi:hypothetical protein
MAQSGPDSVAPSGAPGGTIPTAALDNLSSRFRPNGMCLILLRPDGQVLYHDQAAGLFFHRFVLPMIQYAETDGPCQSLRQRLGQINAGSSISVWQCLPGVLLATLPYVERRQLAGILVLAAVTLSCNASAICWGWTRSGSRKRPSSFLRIRK